MNVLIVEDQLFAQTAIVDALYGTRRDVLVESTTSPKEAIEKLKNLNSSGFKFNLVVSDLQFENGHKSFEVVEYCSKNNIPCMVFSMFENSFLVKRANELGAIGYISKHEDSESIINGMNKLIDGIPYMSPRIAAKLKKGMENWVPFPLKLTPTERNILYCLSGGMSMKEIVEIYEISDNTLRAHRRNMMQKNNCNYEKLLACFNNFPPMEEFDEDFMKKHVKKSD